MKHRVLAIVAAKLAVSIGLLVLVLAKVDFRSALQILSAADPLMVVLWYLLVPLTIWLTAWRWEILAPGLDYRTALRYTWIGVFFASVLPGAIAGDVAKGISLALKDTNARAGLAASIVAERSIGLGALLVFFDLACVAIYALRGEASEQVRHLALLALALSLLGVAAAVGAAMLAARSGLFSGSGGGKLPARLAEGIGSAARFYRNKPALLAKAFLISVSIHVVNILATYLSFRALQFDAGLLFAAIVYPVLSVMLLIPVSISGIGVRDATLAVLFPLFGFAAASGVALSWLSLLAVIPNIVVGGGFQVLEMYRKQA